MYDDVSSEEEEPPKKKVMNIYHFNIDYIQNNTNQYDMSNIYYQ